MRQGSESGDFKHVPLEVFLHVLRQTLSWQRLRLSKSHCCGLLYHTSLVLVERGELTKVESKPLLPKLHHTDVAVFLGESRDTPCRTLFLWLQCTCSKTDAQLTVVEVRCTE